MAKWTSEEDKILIDFYSNSPKEVILSKLPGRIWRSVYKRSIILNLYRPEDGVWKECDDNILKELYPNSPQEFIMSKFPGRTWKAIRWRANNVFGLIRDESIVQDKTRQTNRERRGTDYPTQSASVREKVKKSVQEKYGVDNVFQSDMIKDQIIKTNIKRYGFKNPNQNEDFRKKTYASNIIKYGVDNPFKLVDRVQKGMIDKYGVKTPLCVPKIIEKKKETSLKIYGVEYSTQNDGVKKKIADTNVERYGFNTPLKNETVKQKIIETNLEKYGVSNPAKVEEIKDKIKKTNLEKYGITCLLKLKEVRDRAYAVLKKNKSFNKSKEEIKFKEYLSILDPDLEQHVKHPVIGNVIDFYMPKYDLWVQFDGIYWHGKLKRANTTSRQALKIQKTVERDKYQNENIKNLIRFWSDDVREAIKADEIIELIASKIELKKSISHQYIKKQEFLQEDLKNINFDYLKLKASNFKLSYENFNNEISEFIVKYEWLGTVGVIPKWCFVARYEGILGGVVLINEPTAYSKLLGENTSIYEALIQRGATASWTPKNLGSRLVMFSCNWMVRNTLKRIFVAYGDPKANELGVIYQACNFDYLGNNYGSDYLFKNKDFKNNKWFSPQSLKRTSNFIKWCKDNNISMHKEWFKDNGFKDLNNIPIEIRNNWYTWIKDILRNSEKIKVDKKHKYALLIGSTKKDKKYLISLKTYKALPYPKKPSF